MTRYERIARLVFNTPLAIRERELAIISEVIATRMTGERWTEEEIAARLEAATPRTVTPSASKVAVLPLHGVIAQRLNLMSAMSGGISTQQFTQMFRAAMADPEIKAIAIDVDSPGGSVYGVQELADEIARARGSKPIVAISNSLMASAAYWIGAAADEVWITPSGEAGSIGVIAVHTDESRAEEAAGYTHTIITAGKYKAEGTPLEPLGDEGRQFLQSRVDDYYSEFVKAVARNRGVSSTAVRNGFGQGRLLGATAAVREGLADRVGTLDELVGKLAGNYRPKQRVAAQAEPFVMTFHISDDVPEGEEICEVYDPDPLAADRVLLDRNRAVRLGVE